MSCPEPPMGISGVGSFPLWSGGSLIIFFQLFRCRNLALNRFSYFSLVAGMFYLRGVSICLPYICTPCMFVCSHMFVCPQHPHMFKHPYMSPCSPVYLYVLRGICIWYGDPGALHLLDTPRGEVVPPQVSNTPTNYMLPCMSICSRGYLHVLWGKLSLCWGLGDISTSVRLLESVSTSIGCPLCFILYLSCSSLCLKSLLPWLWLLLLQWLWCLLVCHLYHQWLWLPLWWGFLQCWISMMWFCHHPNAKMLWRCSWPCLCTTAATSIFNASSGLCQLCHGFSTDRFLFQSWASHHLYIICLVSVLVSAFYFQVPCWMPLFTSGGSAIGVCTTATPWSLSVAGICATWWWSLAYTRYAQSGCSLHYIE